VGGGCAPSSRPAVHALDPASRTRTSWMAASSHRCCSSCSPTRASGPAVALKELQSLERDAVMETYARLPVSSSARGHAAVGRRGHEYLDFFCGAGVTSSGTARRRVEAVAISRAPAAHVEPLLYRAGHQARQNAWWTPRSTGGRSCATPPEAVECASSAAAPPGGKMWWLEGAFHGRTYGALSATPQESKQAQLAPLVPGSDGAPRRPQGLHRRGGRVHGGSAARASAGRGGVHVISTRCWLAARLPRRAEALLIFDRCSAAWAAPGRSGRGSRRRCARRDDGGQGTSRRPAHGRLHLQPEQAGGAPVRRSRHHFGGGPLVFGPRWPRSPGGTTRSF